MSHSRMSSSLAAVDRATNLRQRLHKFLGLQSVTFHSPLLTAVASAYPCDNCEWFGVLGPNPNVCTAHFVVDSDSPTKSNKRSLLQCNLMAKSSPL